MTDFNIITPDVHAGTLMAVTEDDDNPSTITAFFPDGTIQSVLISNDIENFDDYDIPDWFREATVDVGWSQTDGWRGHTTFAAPEGWVEFAGGWITGMPDETTSRKLDAADVWNGLHAGDIQPPVPILWCMGVTSNVFSQTSDVFIPAGSEEIVSEWLEETVSMGAGRFKAAFL